MWFVIRVEVPFCIDNISGVGMMLSTQKGVLLLSESTCAFGVKTVS